MENETKAPAEKEQETPESKPSPEKKKLSKGIIAVFGGMGAVIVGLTAALVITNVNRTAPPVSSGEMSSYISEVTESQPGDTTSIAVFSGDSAATSADSTTAAAPSEDSTVPAETSGENTTSAIGSAASEPVSQGISVTQTAMVTSAADPVTTANAPEETPQPAKSGILLEYSVDNSWESSGEMMYGIQFGVTNNSGSSISGWELVMDISGLNSCQGWNGTFTISGNTLTVKNAEYNGDIGNNGSVVVGCNLGVTGALRINSAKLNGVSCTVKEGHVDQNAQNNNNNGQQGGNGGQGEPAADVSELLKRPENAVQGDDWLFTDGNRIVDKNGKRVWLTGVNWFGYNTGTNTFDGLWNSELKPTVEAIADHGFNLIRVPISAELINQWAAGEYPRANYNNAYNTVLNGMNSLQIFDYFLKLAEENGIKVMPDIHSAETNASGHNVNLWYTSKVSVEDFYSALEWMADRYKDNDTIIAYDIKNEPHGKPYEGDGAAIWNDSRSPNNWKYTAETAAARILAKNPNVLIMVEGTEIYPTDLSTNSDYHSTNEKDYYFNWWGGNLRGRKGLSDRPRQIPEQAGLFAARLRTYCI